MKKVLMVIAVAFMFAFVACGPNAEEIEKTRISDSIAKADSLLKVELVADSIAKADSVATADTIKSVKK